METGPFSFVHDEVRRQAKLDPGRVALVDEAGRRIAYGELIERAGQLAARLRGLAVLPDDRVAVYMERSVELVVSLLATLEAGGAYAPLDPSLPGRRIAAVLDDLRPAAVVTDREAPEGLRPGVPVLGPEGDRRVAAAPPAAGLQPDHLAYVLYTSGSTGVPKGVSMSHRGLTRLIRWQLGDGPAALSTLQFTALGFDVTFQELFSTLCTGGTLFLVPDAVRRDPELLLLALEASSIQRLFLPYVALLQLAKASRRLGVVPRSLRHVITAGERMVVTESISALFRALPHCRLDNHYGPSEAHLVTSFTLPTDPSTWPTLPPIGRPVDGVSLYCLDADLAPVAPGEIGELYVGGEGVARGYLNAPALTAERFGADPFDLPGGSRMYRTGDLARIDADGLCHFVGRADDQIKVSGFRIEPAEVELTLTEHPGVRQAAVVRRAIADEVDGLVAFVVADGPEVTAAELSRHTRAALPSYMAPARFVHLDALPLTPSGKVDRRALGELGLAPAPAASTADASLAEAIRAIWQRVLGHDELEPDDDFFDVGGDSLLAAWVVTEIGQVVGREIELSFLLRNSTLAGIVGALEEQAVRTDGARRTSEIVTLRAGPSRRPLYLVHPLGGELLAYRELARSIRSQIRVLGLRWWPAGEVGADPLSLEEMAAVHAAQLVTVQPQGPYLLAGWSFGGVLAFELAQQLRTRGERVDFLGLFDANPLRDPITGLKIEESPHLDLLTKALEALEALELDPGATNGASGLSRLLADPTWHALMGDGIPEGVTAAHLRKNLEIARHSMQAAMRYRPAPYGGAIDLFQAADSPPEIQDSLAAELSTLAHGSLRVHQVPGDHWGILRPPLVATTAQTMDIALGSIGKG